MVKSELAEWIAAKKPHLYRRDAELIINTILDTISTALARGDRVELRDFGIFTVKLREAYSGRNPRNRAEVAVSKRVVPVFKTSRAMKHRVNNSPV